MSDIEKAMNVLRKAMQKEPDYAHTWHCNIAMSCYDSMGDKDTSDHDRCLRISNEAASRFMKLCFDVETKQ